MGFFNWDLLQRMYVNKRIKEIFLGQVFESSLPLLFPRS